jgi:uncharacterized membrane protein
METNKRSIIKTITWRITGSSATFLIAYIITGNLAASGVIGLVQIVSNTILYYVHERIWNLFKWERNNV